MRVPEEGFQSVRGLTIAGRMGDLEISWDPQNDARVREMIVKKMAQGIRFFIVKPLIGNTFYVRRRITGIEQIRANSVQIRDADIMGLFSAGEVALFRTSDRDETERLAVTADEVVTNRTIGVPALAGG